MRYCRLTLAALVAMTALEMGAVDADTYIDYLAGDFGVSSPQNPSQWLWVPNPLTATGFGAPVLNDQNSGLNAWRVTDSSTATPNPSYVSNLSAGTVSSALANGWRLRAQARLVDDYESDGDLGIAAFLNGRAYVMSFDLTTGGDLRVTLQDETPRTFQVTTGGAGTAAYNHFELQSLAGRFVDPIFEGRSLTANWDGVVANTGHPGIVQWGSVLNVGTKRGVMNYHLVQFDIAPTADLAGDFDWNGRADGEDLLTWQRGFGSTTALLADADGNGAVTSADFSIWADRFGELPRFTTPLPEPATLALAPLALWGIWARRRRRADG